MLDMPKLKSSKFLATCHQKEARHKESARNFTFKLKKIKCRIVVFRYKTSRATFKGEKKL